MKWPLHCDHFVDVNFIKIAGKLVEFCGTPTQGNSEENLLGNDLGI